MALILSSTGKETKELKVEDITIEKLQEVIGSYVERIVVAHLGKVLYVNDEAALTGLPFNPDASSIAGMTLKGDAVLLTKEEDNEWQR